MTMRNHTRTLGVLLTATLAACGSSDNATHALTSGTYVVSSATGGAPPDANPECSGFLSSYQATPAKTIALTVSGTSVSIDTGGIPADDTLPTVTIVANALEVGGNGIRTITGSGTSGTCNVLVTKTFSGTITADNAVELTYTFKAAKQAASGTCDDTNSVILPIPCSSAIHFLATKQ
jgi:hypothetical protein